MLSYYTELDIEECRKKINEIIRFDWSWDFECRIKGRVSDRNDSFHLKNNIHCRNSFSRIFHGELVSKGNGTIICGDFHVPIGTKIFMTIWFLFIILFWLMVLIAFLFDICQGTSNNFSSGIVLLVPPCMVIFGVFFVSAGIENSKKDEEYVLQLLKNKLKTQEIETTNKEKEINEVSR